MIENTLEKSFSTEKLRNRIHQRIDSERAEHTQEQPENKENES